MVCKGSIFDFLFLAEVLFFILFLACKPDISFSLPNSNHWIFTEVLHWIERAPTCSQWYHGTCYSYNKLVKWGFFSWYIALSYYFPRAFLFFWGLVFLIQYQLILSFSLLKNLPDDLACNTRMRILDIGNNSIRRWSNLKVCTLIENTHSHTSYY